MPRLKTLLGTLLLLAPILGILVLALA